MDSKVSNIINNRRTQRIGNTRERETAPNLAFKSATARTLRLKGAVASASPGCLVNSTLKMARM